MGTALAPPAELTAGTGAAGPCGHSGARPGDEGLTASHTAHGGALSAPKPGAGTQGDLVSDPDFLSQQPPRHWGQKQAGVGSRPGLTKCRENLSGREASQAGRGDW